MRVVSLHIAPASRLPMKSVDAVEAEAGRGLIGDRYHGSRHRHVTVQSAESLELAAKHHGSPIDPGATWRNITLSAARCLQNRETGWSSVPSNSRWSESPPPASCSTT